MATFLVALAAGLGVSLAMERWREPSAASLALHCGLYLAAFAAVLALAQRPLFAATLVLAGQLLLHLVSSAKRHALREPLVFSDLGLFAQALRHPRLYLPYLGAGRAAAAAIAFAVAVGVGLALEPAVALGTPAWIALAAGALALAWAGARRARPGLVPELDLGRFGLPASLWLYRLAEARAPLQRETPFAGLERSAPAVLPHVVAVQVESFFDARRLYPGVAPACLERFDALGAQGESGRLAVPAWGAYTMRTEFAFLSGIAPAQLGVHRFDPYRRAARVPLVTLAAWLRALGYRTICVHPYPASFFGRDGIFPGLGFEQFIDAASFEDARREGPYVADAEVGTRLAGLLRESERPLFVFAITMENHGPLHLERVAPGDESRLYREAPSPPIDELTIYLRHLRNSDALLGALAGALASASRPGVLCAYGDHVPSLPHAYARLGYEDGRTDYLIWRSRGMAPRRADLPAEALGLRLLVLAGLAMPRA